MPKNLNVQVRRIADALFRSGRSYEDMSPLVGVKPDSLRKVAKGYQPASEQLIMAIEQVAAAEECTPRALLRKALKKKGWTVGDLAHAISHDTGVIQNVVFGTGRASERMIEEIVKVLPSLSKEDLMDGTEHPLIIQEDGALGTFGAKPRSVDGLPKPKFVPLLSWAQAGCFDAAHGDADAAYEHQGVFSSGLKDSRGAFAVEIRGDSMSPEIEEGDYVIVAPQLVPRPGDRVLVRTKEGDVMCKVYQPKGKNAAVFVSVNNALHPPIEIPKSEIVWIYPVKQVQRNY